LKDYKNNSFNKWLDDERNKLLKEYNINFENDEDDDKI
jgi:hypothetical protein